MLALYNQIQDILGRPTVKLPPLLLPFSPRGASVYVARDEPNAFEEENTVE